MSHSTRRKYRNLIKSSQSINPQPISPAVVPEITQKDIFPPFPPDYIFKNRKARTAPSVDVAKKYITYLYDRIDYVKGEGILYYYKGVELPRKGVPFAQAVYSINPTKRVLTNLLRIFSSKEIMFFLRCSAC